MRKIAKFIRNSVQTVVQQVNTVYKKESQYVTAKQSSVPKTKANAIKLSKNEYFELDKFFIRFFNSKPIRGRVAGKSLAFVVGAQNVGKSEYIEKNLGEIKRRKKQLDSEFASQKQPEFDATKSPQSYQVEIQESVFENSHSLIVKKNYKEQGGQLNFRNFVQDLHNEVITQIHEIMIKFENYQRVSQKQKSGRNSEKDKNTQSKNLSLLTADIVKEIVIHEFAPEYIFIHIKDVIFAIIQQKDLIFLKKQHRQAFEQWNDQNLYGGACTCEQFFQKLYHPLIQILWNATKESCCDLKASEQVQKAQIAIKLFYSVFMRIEYENRPSNSSYSWYQTGIQTTNFLFDLLNFLSGTGKYVEALQKAYTNAQITQERQEAKQFLQKSDNFILLGNHIDVMLCLMNLEDLICFKNKSKPFLDFFDHLICRTVNSSNIRKHFPVIIQIPNRAFLDDTLQLGKIEGSNPVIIQIPGYIQHYMKFTNVIQIFEEKKLMKMFHNFGRNPHTWKLMLENMAKGVTMEEIQEGNAPYQIKQKKIAEAKMNRVYTSARCLQYLNKKSLDFEIREVLELYSKMNGMGRSTMNFMGTMLFKQAYFTSMMEQNIFYHMYYLPYVDYGVSLPAYLSFFRDEYLGKLKRNNSELEYKKWQWLQKDFSLMKLDLRYKKVHEKLYLEHGAFGKEHQDLQFATTYYSPLQDYGLQYYNNAHSIANIQ